MKIIPLPLALGFVITLGALRVLGDDGNPKRADVVAEINRGIVKRSAGEPVSADAQISWSPKAAAKYLDGRLESWLAWTGAARGHGTVCVSCHTTMPIALACQALGARLGETAGAIAERKLIDNVKNRVENWTRIVSDCPTNMDCFDPYYMDMKAESLGTESVLNALVLVHDSPRGKDSALNETARTALRRLWDQQQKNGSWLWLDFGLNPWEKEGAYYGASLAALAVGMAGKDYYEHEGLQSQITALKTYLRNRNANQPLHHRVVALWASSWLAGLLTGTDEQQIVEELLNAQESDGGWSLPKLGKKESGAQGWTSKGANPEGSVSDGYATGLVVLALKRAGLAADNQQLQKGVAWLAANERDGTWPVNHLNKRRDPQTNTGMFMQDAATAFAVLALTEPTRSGSDRQ